MKAWLGLRVVCCSCVVCRLCFSVIRSPMAVLSHGGLRWQFSDALPAIHFSVVSPKGYSFHFETDAIFLRQQRTNDENKPRTSKATNPKVLVPSRSNTTASNRIILYRSKTMFALNRALLTARTINGARYFASMNGTCKVSGCVVLADDIIRSI